MRGIAKQAGSWLDVAPGRLPGALWLAATLLSASACEGPISDFPTKNSEPGAGGISSDAGVSGERDADASDGAVDAAVTDGQCVPGDGASDAGDAASDAGVSSIDQPLVPPFERPLPPIDKPFPLPEAGSPDAEAGDGGVGVTDAAADTGLPPCPP